MFYIIVNITVIQLLPLIIYTRDSYNWLFIKCFFNLMVSPYICSYLTLVSLTGTILEVTTSSENPIYMT